MFRFITITSYGNAFVTNNLLLLRCRFAFAQKTSAAAASLSRKKHLLLPLRFRAKDICSPSGSLDATSWNGNQPYVMGISHKLFYFAFKLQLFRGKNYRQ
ncbi:hypothetical protein [Lysinibacillus xylanilyticus]|uniref:hypothetical protein n=1 Tax=Lysinibacillus xylanilyticus TaxID=582475 RepID=UPI00381B3A76